MPTNNPTVKKGQHKRRGLKRPPRLFFISATRPKHETLGVVAEFVYCCRTESEARNCPWSDKLKKQGYILNVIHGGYANRNWRVGMKWGKWEADGRH